MKFAYSMLETDEIKAIYAQMIQDWAIKFDNFWTRRNTNELRTPANIERAFRGFWMTQGPTSFESVTDSSRFRKELLAACIEETAMSTPASVET